MHEMSWPLQDNARCALVRRTTCPSPACSRLVENVQFSIGPPTLADGMHLEANPFKFSVVQYATTIEEECRLHHRIVELAVWVQFELVPLCQHGNRMCFLHCLLRSAAEDQPLLIDLHVVVLELFHGVLLLDLGVEDMHNGTILQ